MNIHSLVEESTIIYLVTLKELCSLLHQCDSIDSLKRTKISECGHIHLLFLTNI